MHDLALLSHALDDLVETSLNNDTADNHLAQHRMLRLEIEDEIQLAHVFEQAVQRLDKDLDQVKQCQRRLGRRADRDEVQRCIVPVRDERGVVRVLGCGQRVGVGRRGGGEEGREAGGG